MDDTEHAPGGRALRKATLFCGCGHRSPVKGDWRVTETDSERRYDCPACGATITVRPKLGAGGGSGGPSGGRCDGRRGLAGGPTPSD